MKTQEKFANTMQELRDYVRLHKKPVWLVPRLDDYALSCIKPEPSDLPEGTAAVLYDQDLECVDTVTATPSPRRGHLD